MYKVDLHIHTDAAIYEKKFNFSMEKLKEYVETCGINVIAITNHNHFNKEQFVEIRDTLKEINVKVLPGVEIDIENSHLLLIGNESDIDDINIYSNKLEIKNENDSITFEQFIDIFKNYKNYILIPHYKKKPKMQRQTIEKFKENIKCGEVGNVKNFERLKKRSDELVPVYFSDIRISDELNNDFPSRYTYVDINNFSFSVLKEAFTDRNKVYINDSKLDSEFEILPDGTTASSKLNVIIGKRSSGKTHTLNAIYNSNKYEDNIKYIEQFSLTGQSEKTKFKELLENDYSSLKVEYLKPLKDITSKIVDIDDNYDQVVDDYLDSLKSYADNQHLLDEYSKVHIFSEQSFSTEDNLDTKKIIDAVLLLLETKNNRELIDEFISCDKLMKLLIKLIEKRENEHKCLKLKENANNIMNSVKEELQKKSAIQPPLDINLNSIVYNRNMIKEYDNLCTNIKEHKCIKEETYGKFKIIVNRDKYTGAKDIKKVGEIKNSFKDSDFKKIYYNESTYEYIKTLFNDFSVMKDKLCETIINININVLNDRGAELSGGEKAEYNLLRELKNANRADIVLLDEPEASFDNQFIKEYLIENIKELSDNTTVFLTTHNNTLGISLKPNKIIYTEFSNGEYKVYTNDFGSKELKNKNGEIIKAYDNIIDIMEAGVQAYNERKRIYENIKD